MLNELAKEASCLIRTKFRGWLALLLVVGYLILAWRAGETDGAKILAASALAYYFGSRAGEGDTR
jgi:hypothetical protein